MRMFPSLDRYAVAAPARNDVEMCVDDVLPGVQPVVEEDVIAAVVDAYGVTYFLDGNEHLFQDLIGYLREVRIPSFGDHEDMPVLVIRDVDGHEREGMGRLMEGDERVSVPVRDAPLDEIAEEVKTFGRVLEHGGDLLVYLFYRTLYLFFHRAAIGLIVRYLVFYIQDRSFLVQSQLVEEKGI